MKRNSLQLIFEPVIRLETLDLGQEPGPSPLRLARQSPPMAVRDEFTLLLHAAAEIEHSLMVQYLYAAFSLPERSPQSMWKAAMLQVAREEMGHLMAIQNILFQIGSPLNFEREDFPYNDLYPYPFRLESLSLHSISRYVLAEMPDPREIPPEFNFNLNQVIADSKYDGSVSRVGILYESLAQMALTLAESDLYPAGFERQGDLNEWKAGAHNLIVRKVGNREDFKALLEEVGEQGEGLSMPADDKDVSHFEKLLRIYNEMKEHLNSDSQFRVSLPVPENPTVRDKRSPSYLSDSTAFLWGDIFNHRYRWLLTMIYHTLQLSQGVERTNLKNWCFLEMGNLTKVADVLVHLPREQGGDANAAAAAPPFELPFSLQLPFDQKAIWRHHLMLATHSLKQLTNLLDQNTTTGRRLRVIDERRIEEIQRILSS